MNEFTFCPHCFELHAVILPTGRKCWHCGKFTPNPLPEPPKQLVTWQQGRTAAFAKLAQEQSEERHKGPMILRPHCPTCRTITDFWVIPTEDGHVLYRCMECGYGNYTPEPEEPAQAVAAD